MFERLFQDIGKKIKGLAKWSFIVESVGVILTCLMMALDEPEFIALLLLAPVGIGVAYVCSWVLYGIGELIDKTVDNERNTNKIANILSQMEKNGQQPQLREEDLPQVLKTTVKPKPVPVAQPQPAAAPNPPAAPMQPVAPPQPKPAPEASVAIPTEKPAVPAQQRTLKEHLAYALRYQTDSGMITYLERLEDPAVKEILKQPRDVIRGQIKQLMENA